MSFLFKAKGNISIGLFLIRITLGTYTLVLGIQQASNIQYYIQRIQALNILSENTAFIVGFIFPFLLIIFGSLYIIGFFTPSASSILALIQLLKIFSRGLFYSEGIPFNKEMIFFACFLATLFTGAGMISFDALLDRKKKKPVHTHQPVTATVTAEVITEEKPKESPTTETTP